MIFDHTSRLNTALSRLLFERFLVILELALEI